jgi:hypothetical protein
MTSKYISFILFFLALILIIYSLTKESNKCPPQVIKYKYIKRDFNEIQNKPIELNKVFNKMFNQPSPWIGYSDDVSNLNISQ